MAVGDQAHWFGGHYSNVAIRPASGVEVVLKEVNGSLSSTSNWSYFYHRTANDWHGATIVAGGHNMYSTYYTQPSAYSGDSGAPAYNGIANMSLPINNTNYLNTAYSGDGSGFKAAGYVTKE